MPPGVLDQVSADPPSNPLLVQTARLVAVTSTAAPLDSGVLCQVASIAAGVANQFRDASFRRAVGATTNVIPACYAFLKRMYSTPTVDHTAKAVTTEQLMSVLANIVLVHDDNRRKSLNAGAAPVMTKILQLMLKAAIQKSEFEDRAGACLHVLLVAMSNLCINCVPARKALIEAGILVPLSELLEATFASHLEFCLATLEQIHVFCTVEDALGQFPQPLLITLSRLIVSNGSFPDDRNKALDKNHFAAVKMSAMIIAHLTVRHPAKYITWPFSLSVVPLSALKKLPESKPMWDQMLSFIRYSSLPIKGKGGDLKGSLENEWNNIKQDLVGALACAFGLQHPSKLKDGALDPICETLIGWMADKELVESQPIRLAQACTMLSNLVCNELSCRKLVEQFKILAPLAAAFQVWAVGSSAETTPDLPNKASPIEQRQLLQSMHGLAMNLAVLESNRPKIAASGIMASTLECFKPSFDNVTPLQTSPMAPAIKLLQMLCQQNSPNVERLLELCNAQPILDLIWRTKNPFVKIEASRLFGYIVIAAGSQNMPNGIDRLQSEVTVDTLVCLQHMAANAQRETLVNEAHQGLARISPSLAPVVFKQLTKSREAGEPAVPGALSSFLNQGMQMVERRGPGSPAEVLERAKEAASKPIGNLQTPVKVYKTGFEVLIDAWTMYLGDNGERKLASAEIRKNAVVILKSLAKQLEMSLPAGEDDKREIKTVIDSLRERAAKLPTGLKMQKDICDVVDGWAALNDGK